MRSYINWEAQEDWAMRFAVDSTEEYFLLVRAVHFSTEEDGSAPELKLRIQLRKALFHKLESLRWFSIPVVYTDRNQINFHEEAPIFAEVVFLEWKRLLSEQPLPEGGPQATLSYIFTQLQENMLVYSPLNYRVAEVSQSYEGRRISFTWAQIRAWEYGSFQQGL